MTSGVFVAVTREASWTASTTSSPGPRKNSKLLVVSEVKIIELVSASLALFLARQQQLLYIYIRQSMQTYLPQDKKDSS